MASDYKSLDNPYTDGVLRTTSLLEVGGDLPKSDVNIDGQSVALPSEGTKNTWLEGSFKSRNYAPKSTGFFLDARTGRISATGFYVDGVSMVADVGIFVGADVFADAPFSVDMNGNVIMTSATITGGVLHYGKTSFTDSVNAGYWISPDGLYFGAAADSTYVKYDIVGKTIFMVGTLQTAIGTGQRVILSAADNNMEFYDDANTLRLRIGGTANAGNVVFVNDDSANVFPAMDIRRTQSVVNGGGTALHLECGVNAGYALDVLQNANTPGIHIVSSDSGQYAVPAQLEMRRNIGTGPGVFFYQLINYRGSDTSGNPNHVALSHYIGNGNPDGIVNGSKGDTMQASNGRMYLCQGNGIGGSWGNSWVDIASLQWGTIVTSDPSSLSGLWMIVDDNSPTNTTGFQSTIYDIQTHPVFAYQANIGTTGLGGGMMIKGIGSETTNAESKHLILWDQQLQGTNKVLSIGNDTQNNGYKEKFFIQANGDVTMGPSSAAPGDTAELRFRELAANGDHHVALKAPDSLANDVQLTLPDTDGAPFQFLQTDGGGRTSWAHVNNVFAITYAANYSVDWNEGNIQTVTLTGDITFTFANAIQGMKYIIFLTQGPPGGHLVSWPATIRWRGGAQPTLTTTASKTDIVTMVYVNGQYFADTELNL